ncbi:MAG: T9SS type A sorting domain-containing protein [Flavobacteriales bacterium]
MKNVLLSLASLVALGATAQEVKVNKEVAPATISKTAINNVMSARQSAAGAESRWLNWAASAAYYNEGIDLLDPNEDNQDGVFDLNAGPFLTPDSLMMVEFTDGFASWYIHGVATVIEPSALDYEFMDGVNNPGKLDSISIDYIYQRATADAITDKMEVTILKHNTNTYTWGGTESAQEVAYVPAADINELGTVGSFVHQVIEVDLNVEDTTGLASISLDVSDLNLGAAERVGVAVRFIPGYDYTLGDTLVNKNYFRVPAYEENEDAEMTYDGTFNHSYSMPTGIRYNTNTNGWNGNFIPASAYTAGFSWEHYSIWMKVESLNISTPELDKLGLSIYPNPTNGVLNINTNNSLETSITVHNMLGQLVASDATTGSTSLDITAQEAGVYFVTVKNDLGSSTSRIVKN